MKDLKASVLRFSTKGAHLGRVVPLSGRGGNLELLHWGLHDLGHKSLQIQSLELGPRWDAW